MPKRIQRKRVKGWRMPENTVSVTRPGKWGNPYRIIDYPNKSIDQILEAYRSYVDGQISAGILDIQELRGKDLACFCPLHLRCHADILLELANS
jgi:hypothetical protein